MGTSGYVSSVLIGPIERNEYEGQTATCLITGKPEECPDREAGKIPRSGAETGDMLEVG